MKVDLNCDMGESFGAYTIGQDENVLSFITSANIACGYHAGDPTVMAKTIIMALKKGVGIGAHPGYPDLMGFGRRPMQISPKDVYHLVMYQIAALQGMTRALGGKLQHIKPHGALYNTSAKDIHIAEAVAEATYHVAPEAILFGLANSHLVKAGERLGLKTAHEVFADRTYQADGSLTPRSNELALIHDLDTAISQVVRMVTEGKVAPTDGADVEIKADTICIHGDGPSALQFAQELGKVLRKANIDMESIGKWKAR
jgi:UPF0271 protein